MRIRLLSRLVGLVGLLPTAARAQGTEDTTAAVTAALRDLPGSRPDSTVAIFIRAESVVPRAVLVGAARALGYVTLERNHAGTAATTVVLVVKRACIGPDSATFLITKSGPIKSVEFYSARVLRNGHQWILKERKLIGIT
jgi:hypothetical protein